MKYSSKIDYDFLKLYLIIIVNNKLYLYSTKLFTKETQEDSITE